MQFLKTLFWFLLAVVVAVFSIGNWTTVPIKLWAGLIADVNLPLLLILTFLSGLLPVLFYHHAVKWRLRQKLTTAERAMTDLRAATKPSSYPSAGPDAAHATQDVAALAGTPSIPQPGVA